MTYDQTLMNASCCSNDGGSVMNANLEKNVEIFSNHYVERFRILIRRRNVEFIR